MNGLMAKRLLRIPAVTLLSLAFLLAFLPTPTSAQNADEAGHVYFLLAVDSLDSLADRLGLDLDGKHMADVIRWAMKEKGFAEGPGGRFTIKLVDGREFSEKVVLDYFRKLRPGPKDTLVFYFTGH